MALDIGTTDLISESDGRDATEESVCATCRGAGFLRYNVTVGDPNFGKIAPCPSCGPDRERERIGRVAERISADCGLEAKQRTLTLDNFEPYIGNTKVLAAARHFVEKGIDLGQWLVIRGRETGTGKTHILAGIANAAIARGIPTIYTYTTDLLDHLRAGYRRTADPDGEELGNFDDRWERVKKVQLLLLDDLGVQVNSPWARERIEALVDARVRAGLPLVVTTNLLDAELTKISPRVFDRFDRYQPAEVVEMLAIKYRIWKRQQEAKEIPF